MWVKGKRNGVEGGAEVGNGGRVGVGRGGEGWHY